MKVTELPFNKFIGLKEYEPGSEYLLELPENENHLNHLNTVHASALFSLAEASSGEFLLRAFGNLDFQVVPVVRYVGVKYKKPAEGRIRSKAKLKATKKEEIIQILSTRGRATINVEVILINDNIEAVPTAEFDWFWSRKQS
jgi:acyl-coenzyme A thioesterase PaaI-like protein